MSIAAEGTCPVCGEPATFYIDDPDADSEVIICEGCRAILQVSFPLLVEIVDDEIKVKGCSIKFECPRCHLAQSLEIEESGGQEETVCEKCDATFALFWSNWGWWAGDVLVESSGETVY